MHQTLHDAVARARTGDAAAFDVVAATFAPSLLRFSTVVLSGDADAAHDVVQETLLAAWRSIAGLRDAEHCKAWLFRVAHRQAITWLRRRRPPTPAAARRDGGAPRPPEEWAARPEPPRGGEADEAAARLRALVARLPERYGTPIALCHFEGLGLRETARVLGVRVSTLKMRMHRGRRLLRRALRDAPPPPRRATASPPPPRCALASPPPTAAAFSPPAAPPPATGRPARTDRSPAR